MTPSGVDERLELLADADHRVVLEYLRGGRRHASVDELASILLATREARTGAPTDGGDRIRVQLRHASLPKLDAHGFVDWDRRNDEVRYREDEVVEALLDALPADPVTVER